MRGAVLERLSLWLLIVAGIALAAALFPAFFCTGLRVDICEVGTELGDLMVVGSRVAWVVMSVCVLGALLARIMWGGETSNDEFEEDEALVFVPAELSGNRVATTSVVEPIALDTSLEFGVVSLGTDDEVEENPDSVMAFVQETVEHKEARMLVSGGELDASAKVGGFYCPPGLEGSQILYVNGEHAGFDSAWTNEERIGERERAFGTIVQAVTFAQELVLGTDVQVQIRVVPGVYTCGVQVPDRVVLINDRMPAGNSAEEYAAWLEAQKDLGHPDRVTLHAEAEHDWAVVFLPGRMQGLYGCYVVGRDGVKQGGVRAAGCQLLRVFCCVIEGFSTRGMEITTCGSALPGSPVEVVGSVLCGNSSREGGGALYAYDSALRLEQCIFENNRAELGGAIWAKSLRAPLLLKGCRLARNRALGRRFSGEEIEEIGLEKWQGMSGLGGAIALRNGRLKIVDSCFEVNDAALGGGAVAVLDARVAIECSLGQTFVQNRAKIGGGMLVVGWRGAKSVVKATDVVIQSCQAEYFGGGLALVGLSNAQFTGGHFYGNHCADQRSAGGAVAVLKGAVFAAVGARFSANVSEGVGGALAVINATLRMSEQCAVKENRAAGAGGGIYSVTRPDSELERLSHEPGFSGPFALQLKDVRICGNRSGGEGSGVRAGNAFEFATFPLKIDMLESVYVYENVGEMSLEETLVVWAGETRFGGGDVVPIKVLLG